MALGYLISYLVFEPIANDKLCMLSTPALIVWNKSLMFNCNGFPLDVVGLAHKRYTNTYPEASVPENVVGLYHPWT